MITKIAIKRLNFNNIYVLCYLQKFSNFNLISQCLIGILPNKTIALDLLLYFVAGTIRFETQKYPSLLSPFAICEENEDPTAHLQ